MANKILPYNRDLKFLARKLRKQGILSEVLLWKQIKNKSLGVEFHRQVPILNYIVDFYCHELFLAIEIDGHSHYTDSAKLRDKKRQEEMEALGVKFIRFADSEVKRNMRLVLDNLRDKIAELQ